jgi:hypothetical protein
MHLALAEEILSGSALPPATRGWLHEQRGAFLLGQTAPDVQSVSQQARQETHFYTLPRTSTRPAHEELFEAYPELARPSLLPADQAAFIAGYIAHLRVDEIWLDQIFLRYFAEGPEAWPVRAFRHNVLRTWLDERDRQRLNHGIAQALREAEPEGWLPFAGDHNLRAWRDWLVEQLRPGQPVQTVEVFARRLGIEPQKMKAVLRSPQRMEAEIFQHLPADALPVFHEQSRAESVQLIERYLAPRTHHSHTESHFRQGGTD